MGEDLLDGLYREGLGEEDLEIRHYFRYSREHYCL